MICPKCGAVIKQDAKFCTKCGTNLSIETQGTQKIPEVESHKLVESEKVKSGAKGKRKRLYVFASIFIVLCFFILVGLSSSEKSKGGKGQSNGIINDLNNFPEISGVDVKGERNTQSDSETNENIDGFFKGENEIKRSAQMKKPTESCLTGMVYIPKGEFRMGCSEGDEQCSGLEKPARKVKITRGFCMDKYEVSIEEFDNVMAGVSVMSMDTECGSDCPVQVEWQHARKYCRRANKRLPTEAEWEYAARGGTNTKYHWGNTFDGAYEWYEGNSTENIHIHAVGKKKPNKYGLYDMLGNVDEWVEDCFEWYDNNLPTIDPLVIRDDCNPAKRGGTHFFPAEYLRVSVRSQFTEYDLVMCMTGFRCVMDEGLQVDDRIAHKIVEQTKSTVLSSKSVGKCPKDMVLIPSGKFRMGCSEGEELCAPDQRPARIIEITKSYCLDKFEVTQKEFEEIMDENPTWSPDCGQDCPVDRVIWVDAKDFCQKIGKRLPTEAEWEYAARGGTTTKYYWGETINGDYLWYGDNSRASYKTHPYESKWGIHPVGKKKPNQYGLYDMMGNVGEWVEDCYFDKWYVRMPSKDPVNDSIGCEFRVLRGGDYSDRGEFMSVSRRDEGFPVEDSLGGIGFRCAFDLD